MGHEADTAARAADSRQLGGRLLLVWREHRAKDRADHFETAFLERQRLGVALDELDFEPFGLGPPPRTFEQGWHVVQADDLAAAAGRGESGVPAARRDVEQSLGGAQIERLDKQL